MKYTIKRNHKSIAVVAPRGEITEKLLGEETLTMDFSLTKFVKFQIGDYVEVYGKTYYISVEPTIEKISTREYKYQLVFNGIKYRLAEVQYFFYDEKNQLTMPEFSIMGNARKMVELLVANANRVQSGWSVGTIDNTEHKLVDFSNYNCLGALTRISDEFGLEFWIDEDKSIHLTERKRASGYTFAYGQSNGLKNITRSPYTEASLVTRLYAKGAEKNIPKGYRNGQKALRMGVPYLEKNITQYGVVEHTQTFEDVYPKRVGTVTEVYDNNPLQFTDSTLDFDLNSYNEYGSTILIAGVSAKVIFQTGDLAGYTLEVKQYGYNSATKTFTLLKNKDEKTIDIPSEHFRPRVGDKYILVDIMMPQTYVEEAERELQAKAQEYLDKNSRQRFIYTVTPDPLYMKQIRANIVLGQTVRFTDADFQLDNEIRIVSVTRDIQNPYKISFEIAEQATIVQIVRNYIEKEKKQTALVKTQKQNAEMARRSWLFAKEVQDNIFDNEGYFDSEKIKPLSIETGMLSVGSRMQQFSLPNISLTISDDNLRLKNTVGQMVHLNIDPKFPRTWNIAENETPNFSRNFNYIYLKADKVGNNAVFVVSEQKIMLDSDPVFYYFLVGSISSIVDNVRRIKTSYGFTQVSPNEITTGRISSGNGEQWIDLLQDRIEIKAKVHFAPDSPAISQVAESIQVGGRNLALNSKSERRGIGTNKNTLELLKQSAYLFSELQKVGEYYTISFLAKATGSQRTFTPYISGTQRIGDFALSDEFRPYTATYRAETQFDHIHFYGFGITDLRVKNFKIEKGNKPTDWTPAPEDIEASIEATKAYAIAQDNLLKIQAQSYADGKVTEAEQRAINEATTKMNEAKQLAQTLNNQMAETVRNLSFGGRNYYKKSTNITGYYGAEVHKDFSINGFTAVGDRANPLAVRTIRISNVINSVGQWSVSFWGKSNANGVRLSIDICDGESKSVVLNETYQRYELNFYVNNANNVYNFVDFNVIYMLYSIKDLKIEKGNKPTDWTPAPEDVEANIDFVKNLANNALGLTQAQAQNINTLTAKTNFLAQTGVYGNTVATGSLIVGNGFGANAGLTGLGGNEDVFLWGGTDFHHRNEAPISLSRDGFLRVRNGAGRVIFEIGQKNGQAVFDIYNDYGQKVAGIGQRGVEFLGYIPESYTQWHFNRLSSDWNNEQALKEELVRSLRKRIIDHSGRHSSVNSSWTLYEVKNRADVVAYLYQTGNNFETTANQKYIAYYTTNNKFGSKLPNGIYAISVKKGVMKGSVSDENSPTNPEIGYDLQDGGYYNGNFHLSIEVYNINDGKITQSKIFNIDSNVDFLING